MKKIYLIPWYKHDIKTPWYMELIKKLENLWYEVCFVEISWKFRVMTDYVNQAQKQIKSYGDEVVLGFSFWAMIALKVAENKKFQRVFLCSLSPYFSEDLPLLPKYYMLHLWVRRWHDFSKNYSENTIKNILKNEYSIIYGWDESERLQNRNKKMIEKLNIKEVSVVPWVWHDIANSDYRENILKYFI